jgi:RNA polymerase sigma-70 factor (ECF subfamily)
MTTTVDTEAPAVVTRAQAGDPAAIAELYEQYWGLVFRFCYRRTSNTHMAEDLATDVFVRLIKKVDTFEWRGTALGAWLLIVARNLIADRYKSKPYQKEVHSGVGVDYASEYPAVGPSPEDVATDLITHETVIRMMDQLSPDQREVLRLRFLCEMSMEEAAAAMGKEVSSIKALQFRAVRSMRRLFPDGSPL